MTPCFPAPSAEAPLNFQSLLFHIILVLFHVSHGSAGHPCLDNSRNGGQGQRDNGNNKSPFGRTFTDSHNAHDQCNNGKQPRRNQSNPAQAREKPINANTRAIMPRTRAAVQEGEPLQQDEGEEESEVFIMTLFYRVQ